jgi:hypothetical protein
MESKKQIFFKLIEIDRTLYNILYTLLCVVVLFVVAISMLTTIHYNFNSEKCDYLNYKEWIGLIITGFTLIFLGRTLIKNHYT